MNKEKQIEGIGEREKRQVVELANDLDRILHKYVDISPRQYASKEFSERYRDMGIDIDLVGITTDLLNEGYRKQSGWISVEERLPERGESVLVYSSKDNPIVECRDLVTYMRMGNYAGVTHWMPLPEPPKGD